MVDHQARTISVRGGKLRIEVLEGGSGEPLVYLHGFAGLTGWSPYLDALAQDFHVYAPYHPGVGPSVGLEHLDDLWDLVTFYEELLEAMGLEQTSLLGHSYGGMLAAELAAHCPHRVRRLVLLDALGLWLDDAPVADFFVLSPEERAEAVWYDPTSPAAREALALPEDDDGLIEAVVERHKTLASIGKFCWPIPDRGLRKRIHRITAPTLLLWGAADGIVPPVYGEEFRRLIPNSRLVVLEKCGHVPHQESPKQFFSALSQFLKEG